MVSSAWIEISVSSEARDLLVFLDGPVEFLKISMEKVQILKEMRVWACLRFAVISHTVPVFLVN
jgi:hypothetical protein